jgi:class 3 adenylate cyclase/tetratricopeptide (TPR) repeat protein
VVICGACGRENPDGFGFCGRCGRPLARDAAASRGLRKTVTVLFCDLAESTALGERLDPESLQRVLGQYFERMREVLERHQGTVEKFIGDAVVGVFGVPSLHEDDALRAVRAAVELQAALAELNKGLKPDWGVTLQIRTGVNTGEVVAGTAEAGNALVLGDAVNVAARLQQMAAPGEVLLGQPTRELVRDAVTAERVAPLAVKGKGGPVAAWRLLAVTPDVPGHVRRRDVPMVGRQTQRRLLLDAFDRVVAERACRLVTVLGPAGVGKTRLVEETLASLGEQAIILRGRCLSYGEGITYWPVAEVCRQAAGIARGDTLHAAQSKLAALLTGHKQAEQIASGIATIVGLTEATKGTEETFWAVRQLFEHLAFRRPLVVAFDDLHWAEPMLLDLVEYVANFARNAPMLLVGLARTELLEGRPDWERSVPGATMIPLEPLSSAESGRLIEQLLGIAGIDQRVVAKVSSRAGGNPLFIEELVAKLIDDRLLRREGSRWIVSPELSRLGIPTTIQILLAARLEQLRTGERAALEWASVVGKTFSWAAVAGLAPESEQVRLASDLASLVRRDLLRPDHTELAGEDAYQFRHDLIREAAYQGLPKQDRVELHERFATWQEVATTNRVGDGDEIVAYHLERACQYRAELGITDPALARRAADHLAAAGQRAGARWDRRAASSFLTRARALLPAADPVSLELAAKLVANLGFQGDQRKAQNLTSEGIELARELGDRRLEARLRVEQQLMVWNEADAWPPAKAHDELEQITSVFEQAGDSWGLAGAWLLVAKYEMVALRYLAAEAPIRRAVHFSRLVGDYDRLRLAVQQLGMALVYGPTPVPRAARRCRQLAREGGDNRSMHASVSDWGACLEAMRGDFARADALLGEATSILEDLGPTVGWAPWTGHRDSLGFVATLRGDLASAEEAYRANCRALEEAGVTAVLATEVAYLANTAYEQGRDDEAGQLTEVSERLTLQEGDLLSQLLWRKVRAKVLAARGLTDEALRLSEQAVQLADQTDALNDRADAWASRAAVLAMAGQADEAAAAVERAFHDYASKGNVTSTTQARARFRNLVAETSGRSETGGLDRRA